MDPQKVAYAVIARLEEEGYEAYLVGGCVRDMLMNRPVKDYDVATSALPEQVIASFARTIPTGLKHGTITVVIQGTPVEVTTFRTESKYEDHRRPASVTFVPNLREDLQRRDFTINAIAMDRNDRLIDPFEGRQDIGRKTIRCVGDAWERFEEDALRMLRCLRFASNYGFAIDDATWQALLAKAPLLRHIAMERVEAELTKMIAGADPLRAVRLLQRSGLLRHTKVPLGPLADWLASQVNEAGGIPDSSVPGALCLLRWTELSGEVMRWSLLFAAAGVNRDDAAYAMKGLVFSRRRSDRIIKLLELDQAVALMVYDLYNKGAAEVDMHSDPFKRLVLPFGKGCASDWLRLQTLLLPDRDERLRGLYEAITDHGAGWLEEMPIWERTQLAVTGAEVAEAFSREAGPWTAKVLDRLLADTALCKTANEKNKLLELAEHYGKELEMR
ncbi:CCA tRNA nucleotidyltransferase [Paenibacillus sp. MBLB4367]|uniref:CCA tRNA nucleotidyltransferase n=1 Tax=Paenibacillus sp. MBLB4367 TaxID=3384767 RepID=UPI003908202B